MAEYHRTNPGVWVFLSAILIVVTLLIMQAISSDNMDRDKNKQSISDNLRSSNLNQCMNSAYDDYKKQWDETAASTGSKDGKLPNSNAELLDKRYSDAKDTCMKLYK